ncbi:MAG TPA: hypothetical protein VE967_14490 [Gemmatimonadaceae bacterium]|nr:hypothetical protein [Gemmatimonadaceae bacterium]
MHTPVTPELAAMFGIAGIGVAIIAAFIRPRSRVPSDWDPYRWKLLEKRLHLASSPLGLWREAIAAAVQSALERVRRARQARNSARPRSFPQGVKLT